MELQEGKEKFLQAFGTFGSEWGINRTMAQIHALLLISPEPLSSQQIMDELKISLGNANMNIRALVSWGLIYKHLIPGERKDYFVAEKDMWEVIRKIIIQRKKKELEPLLKVLEDIDGVQGDSPEEKAFSEVIKDIKLFGNKANVTLDRLTKADSSWFVGTFMKMIK